MKSRGLHQHYLSKHSLSLKTRLTERRVLACNRLILAHFGFADLRTDHPFFAPFGRPKPPFGPLFLFMVSGAESMNPLLLCEVAKFRLRVVLWVRLATSLRRLRPPKRNFVAREGGSTSGRPPIRPKVENPVFMRFDRLTIPSEVEGRASAFAESIASAEDS